MAKAKRGFARSDRVADQVQRELADLLHKSLKDPRGLDHADQRGSDPRLFARQSLLHRNGWKDP